MDELIDDVKFHVVMSASEAFGCPTDREEIMSKMINISSNFLTDLKASYDDKDELGGTFQCQIAHFLFNLEKRIVEEKNILTYLLNKLLNSNEEDATLENYAKLIIDYIVKSLKEL